MKRVPTALVLLAALCTATIAQEPAPAKAGGASKKEAAPKAAPKDGKTPALEGEKTPGAFDPNDLARADQEFKHAYDEVEKIGKDMAQRADELKRKGIPDQELLERELDFLRAYIDRELPAKRALRSALFGLRHRAFSAQDRLEVSATSVADKLEGEAKELQRMIDSKELKAPAQIERARKMAPLAQELATVRRGDAKVAQANKLEIRAYYQELEESDRLEPRLEAVARHVLEHGVVTKEAKGFVENLRKTIIADRQSTDRFIDAIQQGLRPSNAPKNAPAIPGVPPGPSEVPGQPDV